MESGVRNRTKNLLLFEIRKGEACPGLVRVGALAASLGVGVMDYSLPNC